MRRELGMALVVCASMLLVGLRASAFDWDPVTDQEKSLQANPLDPGAGAIVLFKRGEMDVQQPNPSLWTTRITTYTRIKILTDAGRESGNVVIDSPKYLRISKIEGRTILPSGEIIPLDASKVFHGVGYQEGKSFAVLTTSFAFSSVEPGAIIEYQTEAYADWFYSPPWIFDTAGLATLDSSLKTVISANLGMDQLPLDTTLNHVSVAQKRTSLGFETNFDVTNLHPIREEPFAVPFRDQAVMVLFNPVEVIFSGQLFPIIKEWNDVARQVSQMVDNMNKSDKEATDKAKELAEKNPDPRGRAEAIYRYLQENITSSNLIGFYLNRTADEVITSKQGDPDDINAVYVTMLKEVKVDADLVLVATHNWQLLTPRFPNLSEFSRMIVRVNLKDGPVYADAAYAGAPFGELPWFERGLTAMAVKGSKLQQVEIPAGSPDANLSVSKFSFQLSSDWKAAGDAELDLKGTPAIEFRGNLIDEDPEKIGRDLTNSLGFGSPDAVVSNITHPDFKDTSQPVVIKAHVERSIVDEAGAGEVLVDPWMEDPSRTPVFKSMQRRSFVLFKAPEKQITTTTWKIPSDIQVEKLPAAADVHGDLADFSHSCVQQADTVTCTRTLTITKPAMTDPHGYPSIKKFFDEVAQHDHEVMLLHKQ